MLFLASSKKTHRASDEYRGVIDYLRVAGQLDRLRVSSGRGNFKQTDAVPGKNNFHSVRRPGGEITAFRDTARDSAQGGHHPDVTAHHRVVEARIKNWRAASTRADEGDLAAIGREGGLDVVTLVAGQRDIRAGADLSEEDVVTAGAVGDVGDGLAVRSDRGFAVVTRLEVNGVMEGASTAAVSPAAEPAR